MKNPQLVDLNFRRILNYGGQPAVAWRYNDSNRPNCVGYCTGCEDKKLVNPGVLDLMSHGCDSSDFETLLGPLPTQSPVMAPVLFLLEDPGGDYGNGDVVSFRGHTKRPPNNHYFWTPSNTKWPRKVSEFGWNFYGPYFAYLMATHGLGNVYITNAVKCGVRQTVRKTTPGFKRTDPYRAVARTCLQSFLTKEVEIFQPRLVFCFGQAAHNHYVELTFGKPYPAGVLLLHPNYIALAQRVHKTRDELVRENDKTIAATLAKSGFKPKQST
jgi:hypothetical protein